MRLRLDVVRDHWGADLEHAVPPPQEQGQAPFKRKGSMQPFLVDQRVRIRDVATLAPRAQASSAILSPEHLTQAGKDAVSGYKFCPIDGTPVK